MVVRPQADNYSAGAWVATQFARRYLTWRSGAALPGSSEVSPALGTHDAVAWAEVAGSSLAGTAANFLVAADTSLHGLIYLDIALRRLPGGQYSLAHFPAIVAAPSGSSAGGALDGARLPSVANRALEIVVRRALANYLSGASAELAADLAPGSRIETPGIRLALQAVERLAVEPSGAVLATVVASDGEGDNYTLSYTVAVTLEAGRWELRSINPELGA
ncbi:MAG: hypothetical protein ABSC56_10160 [Solirubrobacteraceae bacterium]|jgi:hypothetical protein